MSTIAFQNIELLQKRISRFEDPQAYKELYTTLYSSLLRFISGIVKSRQTAEDIVSDLFLKIWEKRKTLEEIHNLRVYCFVAARHLSINRLEKQKREHTVNIEDYKTQLLHPAPDPEERMISAEMLRRIAQAVETLPPRCKMCFKLIKEHGFKYKEAAEILQVSEKTIESQLAIALRKITTSIQFDVSRSLPVAAGF